MEIKEVLPRHNNSIVKVNKDSYLLWLWKLKNNTSTVDCLKQYFNGEFDRILVQSESLRGEQLKEFEVYFEGYRLIDKEIRQHCLAHSFDRTFSASFSELKQMLDGSYLNAATYHEHDLLQKLFHKSPSRQALKNHISKCVELEERLRFTLELDSGTYIKAHIWNCIRRLDADVGAEVRQLQIDLSFNDFVNAV